MCLESECLYSEGLLYYIPFLFCAEQSTRRNHFNHKLVHDNQTSFRLTLDSKAKAGQVKGFVVNPRKDDVKVFDFSENDDQVS